MIKLNLDNAVTKTALKKYSPIVKKLARKMEKFDSAGFEFLGWKDLPENYDKYEFKKMKKQASRLQKEGIEILVVIGIGGSYAGSKAGIDMVQGEFPSKRKMEVIFVGESVSSTNIAQKLDYVQDKNFAINVISKSGTTTEPGIAFRLFRKLLEEKVGINNASKFIIATTDANKGALLNLSKENGYTTFVIPDNIGGRFSVLTPVGLFPMACAGLNINKIMDAAEVANRKYSSESIEKNDAYRYAATRNILGKKFPVEMLVQYEPQMKAFNEWWKQLTGESEGKNQKGILPHSAVFSTDLHSLGQFIQEGSKVLFETAITVKLPTIDMKVPRDRKNVDNLNYLTEKTVHDINTSVFDATVDAHVKVGKVPNIHIEIEKMNETALGELIIFFERAVAMTAYLDGSNPFNQPGVEVYKQNLFKALGKPKN